MTKISERDDTVVTFRIPAHTVRTIDRLAEEHGITRSALLRDLIENLHHLYPHVPEAKEQTRLAAAKVADTIVGQLGSDHLAPLVELAVSQMMQEVMQQAIDRLDKR